MNDGNGTTLEAELRLSVFALDMERSVSALTQTAARWIPIRRANDLARNVVQVLALDTFRAPIAVIQSAIRARTAVLISGDGSTWTWPDDVDPSEVAEAMAMAWREVCA
jgi:hypothetical protein